MDRVTIRRALGRFRRQLIPGAVILTYHRVIDLASDPFHLAVSPHHFAEHMRYMRERCNVLSLGELSEALHGGRIPPRAVSVTFDDGYLDLLRYAYPVLKETQIPATLFIPTGHVGSNREFWWDELERLVLVPERLPRFLDLRLDGKRYTRELGGEGNRMPFFFEIYRFLKPLRGEERSELLDRLADWAGSGRAARREYRTMSREELAELARGGLIEFGAHTVHHPSLAHLPVEQQRSEIVEGRRELAALFGRPVSVFAYPHGGAEDIAPETVELVREEGFSVACTMKPGCVERGDDPCRLKRSNVLNWDLDAFVWHLESFFWLSQS